MNNTTNKSVGAFNFPAQQHNTRNRQQQIMKTQSDKTIPLIIIFYALIFIAPVLLNLNSKLTTFPIVWISVWSLILLFGLWKIETFEVKEGKLTKTNFLGLFRRTITLESIVRYDKKVIDTDRFNSLAGLVKLFSSNKKYLIYRRITITTDKNTKMKLDERTINTNDFNTLYSKIKAAKHRRIN